MTVPSKSPNRFNYWLGKSVTDKNGQDIDLYTMISDQKSAEEANEDWTKNNLEYDLRTSELIINKVRSLSEYGKHLYATLCNNEFLKRDTWEILTERTWSCSWRYAGGILADIMGEGDYMDWYCSGDEGHVFKEIEDDLYSLGWIVFNKENNG